MLPAAPAAAQPSARPAAVSGVVVEAGGGAPIAGATVRAVGATTRETTSDSLGRFVIGGLPAGRAELTVRRIGLAPHTRPLVLVAGDTARVVVRLGANPLRLDGVVVTARETGGADGGTASRIGRDAIEHVQASSLADVLQLVPGQLAANPTLSDARQVVLRTALPLSGDVAGGVAADAARIAALGTAIVLDGVPLSNNANLQTDLAILNAPAGTLPPFSSTAGRGADLRLIPADNVQEVEVIRGIPSARHGDLTAGAILVTSRAGARAPELRVRANPTMLEASGLAGWGAGAVRGVSVDGNLVASQDDPRSTESRFTRGTMQLAWTGGWRPTRDGTSAVTANTRARLWSTLDEQRRAPDDLRYQRVRSARDRGARLDLNGAWRGVGPARPSLAWTASATLSEQRSGHQELVTRDIYPVTGATRDTTVVAAFGRSEYLSRVNVDGRPRSYYARLEGARAATAVGAGHRLLAGVEWRRDGNAGAGRLFDATEPPRQNYLAGDRPRRYDDVPALEQLALYAEDRVSATLLGRAADVQLGLRADRFGASHVGAGDFGTVVAPRLNASWSLVPASARTVLRARAGYGVTAKAPTLAQLHPGPRFFDLVNLNYFAQHPAERLAVVTTRVVQPSAEGLRAPRAAKRELGVEWARSGAAASLTGFAERTTRAFGTTRLPIVLPVERYRVAATPAGRPPEIEATPFRVDTLISAYDVPRNTRAIDTRGVELALDLPEWAPVRTALNLNAAWTRTRATDAGLDVEVDRVLGATAPSRLAVYPGGGGVEAEQLVTSVRLVHRAPAVGLVGSLLVQTVWTQADRPLGRDLQLVGYLDRAGRIVPLTPEQAASPEYRAIQRAYLPSALLWERRPPLTLVNLRLTKALPGGTQLAFYANNALADRPLYQPRRTLSAGQVRAFEQRNPPLFFGVELVATPFR